MSRSSVNLGHCLLFFSLIAAFSSVSFILPAANDSKVKNKKPNSENVEDGDGSSTSKGKGYKIEKGIIWAEPVRAKQIWEPDLSAPGLKKESFRVRIVNFRQSNCRGGTERERGAFGQRYVPGKTSSGAGNRWEDILDCEVDGDPATKDWIETIRFSMKEPLSPATPLWEKQLFGTTFYGGFTFYYANRQPKDGGATEKYNNSNESVHNQQPANDWALHHGKTRSATSPFRSCAVWMWKKEDFGGGAGNPDAKVSFDDSSLFGLYTQRYWQGWEAVRFVAQDGEQLYVSEKLPNDWKESSGGSGGFQLRTLVPAKSKWAVWNPQEGDYKMEFDAKTPFEEHKFTDVKAVGWYLFKDTLDANTVACKWESFECYANVARPDSPSISTNMIEIKKDVDEQFFIATTEISYDLWRKIYQWSKNNGQWCLQPRPMTYDQNGDMGSMKFGEYPHTQTEPVTSITLYDALAFLNAMSEFEGREPVYYTDPSFTRASEYEYLRKDGVEIADDIVQKTKDTVFRQVVWSPFNGDEKLKKRPAIYVKWNADGFRLPTAEEWTAALGEEKSEMRKVKSEKGESTNPVGSGKSNAHGLYDMIGNVWELLWVYGDKLEPDPESVSVAGGGFEYPEDPMKISASPYGDRPYFGNHNIGFRAIRRNAGLAGPKKSETLNLKSEIPFWTIKKTDRTVSRKADSPEIKLLGIPSGKLSIKEEKNKPGNVEMSPFSIGEKEISYSEWKKVYFWAIENGYTFDRDGDMGSMEFKNYINIHSPLEPVTNIGYFDIMAWCNALSEMETKTPLFYVDEGKKMPYKNAWRHRPLEYRNIEHFAVRDRKYLKMNDGRPSVYMRWELDSYRVPTMAEWQYAYSGGVKTKYPWGDEFGDRNKGVGEFAWYLDNSSLKTQNCATKKTNGFGLYDIAGNAMEMVMDSVVKGGQIKKGQKKNPLGPFNPAEFTDHSRIHYARVGFMYDETDAFENNPFGDGDIWAGSFGNITYPEVGFRIMLPKKGSYHPNGLDPGEKNSDATPLNLDRRKQ